MAAAEGTGSASQGSARLARLGPPRLALAVVRIHEALSQPDRLRRHFDQLVVLDVGDRLFQRHPARRGPPPLVLLFRGAELCQLLFPPRLLVPILAFYFA